LYSCTKYTRFKAFQELSSDPKSEKELQSLCVKILREEIREERKENESESESQRDKAKGSDSKKQAVLGE
jgi:hypothetical protein